MPVRTLLTSTSDARALCGLLLAAVALGVACSDAPAAPGATDPAAVDAGTAPALPLCAFGKPSGAYPPGPYAFATLGTVPPGLSFPGADGTQVSLDRFYEPCASSSRIVVVRSSAAWCGPCLWHAAQTRRFLEAPAFAGRLVLVDLLVADRENLPPSAASLAWWQQQVDAPGTLAALDPAYSFGPALSARSPLPEYVFIDSRTMQILRSASDPDPVTLESKIAVSFADADGAARPTPGVPPLFDGIFTENQIDLVRAMKLGSSAPPPDPTNAYGDLPAAVALGKALFSDALLSPSGKVSCATCHDPAKSLGDGLPQSAGVSRLDRNAPSVALAAHSRWQFWDGRADTLWMQALGPIEDTREMASSRVFVARRIAEQYASEYDAVFGKDHPLDKTALSALPAAGKPGDPAYDALSVADQERATRVFVNAGKAIAAFERAIRVKPNALDAYAGGELGALTGVQKQSLAMFFQNGCAQCHWGPLLTDDAFHALRFPTGRVDRAADRGRLDGLTLLAASGFRASSKWSDDASSAKTFPTDAPTMLGAFKTPSLRGVGTSAPYTHGGMDATLGEVMNHYGKRGLERADPHTTGNTEEWVPIFDRNVSDDLPAFLEVLTAPLEMP